MLTEYPTSVPSNYAALVVVAGLLPLSPAVDGAGLLPPLSAGLPLSLLLLSLTVGADSALPPSPAAFVGSSFALDATLALSR